MFPVGIINFTNRYLMRCLMQQTINHLLGSFSKHTDWRLLKQ